MAEWIVHFGAREARIRRKEGPFRRRILEHGSVPRSGLASRLAEGSRAGEPVRFLLSACLCHHEILESVGRIWRRDDLDALARARFAERLGVPASDLAVGLPVSWGDAAAVCALPGALFLELVEAARTANLRLASVRPWISELIGDGSLGLRRKESIAVREPDGVSIARARLGCTDVASMPATADGEARSALAMLESGAGLPAARDWLRFASDSPSPEDTGRAPDALFTDLARFEAIS